MPGHDVRRAADGGGIEVHFDDRKRRFDGSRIFSWRLSTTLIGTLPHLHLAAADVMRRTASSSVRRITISAKHAYDTRGISRLWSVTLRATHTLAHLLKLDFGRSGLSLHQESGRQITAHSRPQSLVVRNPRCDMSAVPVGSIGRPSMRCDVLWCPNPCWSQMPEARRERSMPIAWWQEYRSADIGRSPPCIGGVMAWP